MGNAAGRPLINAVGKPRVAGSVLTPRRVLHGRDPMRRSFVVLNGTTR
jgi:hypothetical protein